MEGYNITGAAEWSILEDDMQDIIITPDVVDSHKATITLGEGASAGEATVQVNIGGYTKTIKLNITDSAESVARYKRNGGAEKLKKYDYTSYDDNKIISDGALVAITLMIAESRPGIWKKMING